jgi:hypothetical protein
VKEYLSAMKQIALGMPLGPFLNGTFRELVDGLADVAWPLLTLILWLLCIATYPISVPLMAGAAILHKRAQERAHEKYLRAMNRDLPEAE